MNKINRMFKNYLVLASLLFFCFQSPAQEYKLMIESGDYKVAEIQEEAERYFEDREKGRGSGYKQFKRWEYMALRLMDSEGYLKSEDFYVRELQKYTSQFLQKPTSTYASNDEWEELGPFDYNATTGWNPGIGRVTAFSIDSEDENHIIVGANTGGVWKTLDGGETWEPLNDYFSNMHVFSTAMHPTDNNIYFFGSNGGRIYKSNDQGETWTQIGSAGNSLVNKILIHPNDSNIMFATSENSGIYRSSDGGETWIKKTNDGRGFDIQFSPDDSSVVFISGSGMHKSTDTGENFTTITGFNSGPKMIGVSPDDANRVYVLEADNSVFGGIYRSDNAGNSFIKLSTHNNKNYFGYSTTADDNLGQAPRDMAIAVNPNNKDEVHIAGINAWRSMDGGTFFSPTSDWVPQNAANAGLGYCHADVDIMEFYGDVLYVGTDGGFFKVEDSENITATYFTDLSQNLGIRQFYKIGVAQTEETRVSGGSQDNGTSIYNGETEEWIDWLGGDGMESFYDKDNSDIVYGTVQFGTLFKSFDNGQSLAQMNSPEGSGNWITPFTQHPSNSNTLYVGYDRIYKSENAGISWSGISPTYFSNLDHIEISKSNPSYIYASYGQNLVRSTNGFTWSNISSSLGFINSIAVHPTNHNLVAVATTNNSKVFVSYNAGINWEPFQLNLPNFQALDLVWDDSDKNGLYLGMNYGVYYINDDLNEWIPYNTNLPNVIINDLEINFEQNKIYAGTYGRGLWVSDLYETTFSSEEFNKLEAFTMSPNPASNKVNFTLDYDGLSYLQIYTQTGQLVVDKKSLNLTTEFTLDVSSFKSGIYFVKVANALGTSTKKLIIK